MRQTLATRLNQVIFGSYHVLLLVTPFLFTWFNEELFEFNKMLFVYSVTVVIALAWVCKAIVLRKITVHHSLFSLLLCFFLLSQLLSTLFSMHLSTSLFGYYTRFNGGLFSLLSYSLLYFVAVEQFSRPQVKQLLFTLGIAGLGIAAFAIPEHFGHAVSCVLIRQEFTTNCWVQDVQHRIFGSFGQPNWLAAYAVTLIPVFLTQLPSWSKKLRWQTLVYGAGSVLLILTLLFTKSRSGWFGLLAQLLALGLGTGVLWLTHQKTPRVLLKVVGLSVITTVVLAALFGTPRTNGLLNAPTLPATPEPLNRLEEGGTDSGEIRKIVWTGAIKVWQRYPLLGSGVETFAYSYYQDRPAAHNQVSEWDFLYNKAHNEYLNYLATTGILGLATFVALHLWWAWMGYQVVIQHKTTHTLEDKTIWLGFAVSIAGLSISNFFGFSTVMVSLLFFLFPAFVTVWFKKSEVLFTKEWPTPSMGLRSKDWIAIAVALVIGCYLLSQITMTWLADFTYTKGKGFIRLGQTLPGITLIENALLIKPNQPVFSDTLSSLYAQLAVGYSELEATESAALATSQAIAMSNRTLQLNPVHLNFYKTRVRVFSLLGQLDLAYLEQAQNTAEVAVALAPSDPKTWYQLGMILLARGEYSAAEAKLRRSLELRPQFDQAQAGLDIINATNSANSL